MPKIVVYGASGNGCEVAHTVLAAAAAGQDWELLGFVDDSPRLQGTQAMGLPVWGDGEWLSAHPEVQVALGIGHPRSRYQVAQRLSAQGATLATIIHPQALVVPSAQLGPGCVVFAGAVLSHNCRLGTAVQVSYGAVVHHDAQVGDFSCVMAHATLAGEVTVGTGCFVGIGVSTRQQVAIGDWVLVGVGAVVVKSLPAYCVAVGVPARPVRRYASPEEMPDF